MCLGELLIIIIWATGYDFGMVSELLIDYKTQFHGLSCFVTETTAKGNSYVLVFYLRIMFVLLFNYTLFSMISWQPGTKSNELCMFLSLKE